MGNEHKPINAPAPVLNGCQRTIYARRRHLKHVGIAEGCGDLRLIERFSEESTHFGDGIQINATVAINNDSHEISTTCFGDSDVLNIGTRSNRIPGNGPFDDVTDNVGGSGAHGASSQYSDVLHLS